MLYAPLEQFHIFIVYHFILPISNFLIINILMVIIVFINISFNSVFAFKNFGNWMFFSKPTEWQTKLEKITLISSRILTNTVTYNNESFLLFILTVCNFILASNLIGLNPYSFTITSHLSTTFFISFSFFLGINIMTVKKYKWVTFRIFFPANTSIFLASLLVPIEFISYLAKPISLGVRLFINLMAGHTLLKVIANFCWELIISENIYSFFSIFPIAILLSLFGLEFGVALIQTYVFITLVCIYIQDNS